MNEKLKIWNPHATWEEAEGTWDKGAMQCKEEKPLKTLGALPRMPGIAETGLKWKSIKYLLTEDEGKVFFRHFFKHPIKYALRFIRSALKNKAYIRKDDFFFYGLKSIEEFQKLLKLDNALFVIGFSYCHKPFECPSGRFSSECIHDPENPVCRQCFIGKAVNALPPGDIRTLFIPTIHYIGEKMFQLTEENPAKQIVFLITACEMTLEMFGDWGNMVGARGIGVRLDGRICNTMKAFELSERGVKPGLTVVLPETQKQILSLVRNLWETDEKA